MDHARCRLLGAAAFAALMFGVAGCGGDAKETEDDGGADLSATPAAQVSIAPPSDAKVIGVTITADSVSPSGAEISVEPNQPVVLEIDAVAGGELHVHSTPEQHVEFPSGKSQVQLEFDQPGVVDIEDHDLDKLIVQLKVL